MYNPIPFTFVDAREFDGNCYEVAEQAIAMFDGILQIAERAAEVADLMARNAYMERNLALGNAPAGDKWLETAEGRNWVAAANELEALRRRLGTLRTAATYDPKHPAKV